MSFASEVKKEILNIEDMSKCCKKAMLFGILQNSAQIVISNLKMKLLIKAPILNAIKVTLKLLKEEYNLQIEEGLQTSQSTLGHKYYNLEIKEKVKDIIDDFKLWPYDDVELSNPILKNECCKAAFVRGCFSVKGSINDPRKECYHLEISCKKESLAKTISLILKEKNIETKQINKGNNILIYIKKSEQISNALALIGASSGVFYFEDSRIYRDFYNMANRLANCDIANARRSAETCEKQLAIIQILKESGEFEKMPIRLQTIARMREDYPDSSLEELASFSDKAFGKALSKSGISHCLKDLELYYYSLELNDE